MINGCIHVLLVEDNPGDARLVRETLAEATSLQFELELADRISSALERLAQGDIQLILLDLSLPDSRGIETVRCVHERQPSLPIVVLTGLDDEQVGVEAVQAGAQDYLVKGHADAMLLTRAIRYAIERQRSEQRLSDSEKRYKELVEYASDIIYRIAPSGHFKFVNPTAIHIMGYSEQELVGKHYLELIRPDYRQQAASFYREQFTKRIPSTYFEFPVLDKAGHELWIGQNVRLVLDYDRVVEAQAVARDITKRRRAEDELRNSEERFQIIAHATKDVIWDWNLETNFIWWNDSVSVLFGYNADEVRHNIAWWFEQVHWEDRDRVIQAIQLVMDGARPSWAEEYRFRRADGSYVHIWDRGAVIRDAQGHPVRILGTMEDITPRKQTEEKLKYLSTHDPLTGLYNRLFFEEELARLRRGRHFPVSVLLADVDGLKAVNDSQGHAAGDELLRAAAELLRSAFRAEDVVARMGGDEFAALLPVTDAGAAEHAQERLRALLARHNAVQEPIIALSVGVVTVENGEALANGLRQADIRMYQEKLARRERASARQPGDDPAAPKQEWARHTPGLHTCLEALSARASELTGDDQGFVDSSGQRLDPDHPAVRRSRIPPLRFSSSHGEYERPVSGNRQNEC